MQSELRHLFKEYYENPFTLKVFGKSSISELYRKQITADLIHAMPSLKIEDYLRVKPEIFEKMDYLVIAFDSHNNRAIGLLAACWQYGKKQFLQIFTILIGEQYQDTLLIKKLYKVLFAQIADFPDIIAFKTFNSKSYNAMKVFARIEGVSVYPKLNGLQDSQIMQIAQEIAKTLEPNLNFQATTGVIEEAGGKVPSNFYPSRPTSNRLEVDEFFSANLTPKDRLLCLLIAHNKSAKQSILKALGNTSSS